ncbi:MAG: glutamate racemase [Patescibacteria group bacterium]
MQKKIKIGIFDSGLGGLIIAKAIKKLMPKYDYVYYGDTKRVPYGNKSHEAVYEYTKEAVDYLFNKENCALVIVACNTASARALRQIQQEYLLKKFKDRKVLGVLIPGAEEAAKYKRVGILATRGTVISNAWDIEIRKLNNKTKVFQNSAPTLVTLAEEGENNLVKPFIQKYLKPLLSKNLNALVLGCTHYPIFKKEIKNMLPKNIRIISQEEIVPKKLKIYLEKHSKIENKLSKDGTMKLLATDKTQNMENLVKKWFGKTKITILEL